MLLVRVRVAPSPIHGLGVFAAEPVARGAAVWRFTPGFDLECAADILESLPPLQRERLLHYGYCDRNSGNFVLCCDDARFLNHAAEPNLVNEPDGSHHGVDRAACDIGEELTVDYRAFECPVFASAWPTSRDSKPGPRGSSNSRLPGRHDPRRVGHRGRAAV